MDEIYEDLENYNDADEIERLRSENNDLRSQLEAQALALEKLKQTILQDYDKLVEGYNKLEKNYSSLLITARNEIERKTQTITNLNIDKDRMVINYATRGRRRNIFSQRPFFKSTNFETTLDKDDSNKSIEEKYQKKTIESNSPKLIGDNFDVINEKPKVKNIEERKLKEEKCLKSNEHACEQLLTSLSERLIALSNKSIVEKKKTPEQKDSKVKAEKKACSIRDRRKSMPILGENIQDIYSDEEIEPYNKKDTKGRYPSKDKTDKRFIETNGSIKSKTTSKTPSLEEKSSYHESKVSHRSSRWETERCTRDKYHNARLRRQSPERYSRNERYEKLDKRRTRVLVSPPHNIHDKYHSKKHRDHRYYDKPEPYDFDRHRYYDVKPMKHRLSNDCEEPVKKRPRYEPQRNYAVDDKVRYDIEMGSDSLAETLEQLESQYVSCQSPDYEQMDALTYPLKEIRETASSPLEDPREKSIRYILRLDDKGKKILTTVVGRNVDIIPIKRENWCLPNVDIPPLLVNKPRQCDDALIKDIYADIDDPDIDQNISMESGEILEPSTTSNVNIHDKLEVNKITSTDHKLNDKEKESKPNETSITVKAPLDKYRIPKVRQGDSRITSLGYENKSKSEETLQISTDISKNIERKAKKKSGTGKEKLPISISTRLVSEQNSVQMTGKEKLVSHSLEHKIPSKGIVEGDLELSDETSDNTELRDNVNNKQELSLDHTLKDKETTQSTNTQGSVKESNSKEIKENRSVNTKSVLDTCSEESKKDKKTKRVSPVSNRKSRGRRKNHKQNEAEKIDACSKIPEQEKKIQPKKDIKEKHSNKFKEIFGTDSSSLITPEDLGLVTNKTSSANYVPFFEDAQDATDVEEIAKVKQDLMSIEKQLEPNNEISSKSSAPRASNMEEKKLVNTKTINVTTSNSITDKEKSSTKTLISEYIENLSSNLPPVTCTVTTSTVINTSKRINPTFISDPTPLFNHINITAPTPTTYPLVIDKPAVLVTHSENHQSDSSPTFVTTVNPAPIVALDAIVNPISIDDSASISKPISENECYTNINRGKLKDADVVKTIIISTGVQPQCVETPPVTITEPLVVNVERLGNETAPNEIKFKHLESIKALATSTPQKEIKTVPELIQTVNESNGGCNDGNKASVVTEQSESSASVSQNESNAPDVRIYVQRRRRTRMKPAS